MYKNSTLMQVSLPAVDNLFTLQNEWVVKLKEIGIKFSNPLREDCESCSKMKGRDVTFTVNDLNFSRTMNI